MTQMTKKDVLNIIKQQLEYSESIRGYGYTPQDEEDQEEYDNNLMTNGDEINEYILMGNEWNVEALVKEKGLDVSKLYFKNVDEFGGEDCGSDYWYVFEISHPDFPVTYVKYQGYYNSWNGTEWENEFEFVQPKEKTVIIWE